MRIIWELYFTLTEDCLSADCVFVPSSEDIFINAEISQTRPLKSWPMRLQQILGLDDRSYGVVEFSLYCSSHLFK